MKIKGLNYLEQIHQTIQEDLNDHQTQQTMTAILAAAHHNQHEQVQRLLPELET